MAQRKWFTSDWHLGHKTVITRGRRNFTNVFQMNDYILHSMFDYFERGDIVYFGGDMAWNEDIVQKVFEMVRQKKIEFHWILGNHDNRAKKWWGEAKTVSQIKEVKLSNGFETHHAVICHYPLFTWNRSHYNSFLLFGHHHTHTYGYETIGLYEGMGKRLNINCEFHDYAPLSEEYVIDIMKGRPDNWDLITKG